MIVEFQDGLTVVPITWRISDKIYFYPSDVKDSKTYNLLLKKLYSPQMPNTPHRWEQLEVIRIFGSDGKKH